LRITHEAEYAVRIAYILAREGRMMPAREISEESGVTMRFALKILRRLGGEGIVISFKGASGGYKLNVDPEELSLGQIIECIDGPLEIAHCLSESFDCTRVEDKNICAFHHVFGRLSSEFRQKLYKIRIQEFI